MIGKPLASAVKMGRRIRHAKPPTSAGGQAAMFAGIGVASGTTNSVINNQFVQQQKRKQQQAFSRGKYYGKSVAK